MAITTTQVTDILNPNDIESSMSVQPFIDTAEALVADVITGLGAAITEQITIWLAAHFYMIMAKALASEEAGDAEDQMQYKLGLNLQVTMYGQQAMMLDSSGELRSINSSKSRNTPSIGWFGTHSAEEND